MQISSAVQTLNDSGIARTRFPERWNSKSRAFFGTLGDNPRLTPQTRSFEPQS
jgi:hypothetical protein